jgi:pimeloyl-ACP methyl ester carboxylesterase
LRAFLETRDGIELFYEQHGRGMPLVFVHGLFGVTEHWQLQIGPFAHTHNVIAYDLRGSGRSSKPRAEVYAITEHADDLRALLDGVSVRQPAVIVGHSMGSCVAIEFALSYPERVAGLCVVDGFACGEHCIVNYDEMKEGVARHASRVELFQRVSFGASFRYEPHSYSLGCDRRRPRLVLPTRPVLAVHR